MEKIDPKQKKNVLDLEGFQPFPVGVVENEQQLFVQGGPGSGHRGHRGRPGLVGGSSKIAGSTVYRASGSARKEGLPGKHVALSTEVAGEYGANVETWKIADDANIVDFSSEEAQPVVELWGNASEKEIRSKAKDLGIDGIHYDFDPSGKFGIVIFNETKLRRIK